MRKELALSLVAALLLMVCDVSVITESEEDPYKEYREYRDSLHTLQQDVTQIFMELHQQKNPQAVYEHILQTIEETAVLIGKAESTSQDAYDILQISLQDRMEMLLVLGLSERQKENLINLGYTEEDIAEVLDWLLHYNDHYHHAVTGFTPEEMERFYLMGLTDEQVDELQVVIEEHYTQMHTAQQMVKQHQMELMHIQVLLSLAALQTLTELNNQGQGKDKGKSKSNGLQHAEEKLLEAILNVSEDQSSLEHVKAFSKQVYKAAEQKMRKGEKQYLVDFFVGLQVHCGALTALHGDPEFGVAEIRLYETVLSECVTSSDRPVLPSAQVGEQPIFPETVLKTSPDTVPATGLVGRIEEYDEINNVGCILVFVKGSDTTLWQAAIMLFGFITIHGEVNVTLDGLVGFLGSCIAAGITVTKLAIGSAGAVLLLIFTAQPVGEEWPTTIEYDPTNTFDEIRVNQATIAHIQEGAQRPDRCERSSHQAIIDEPWRIRFTIEHAIKVYRSPIGQYFYYAVDGKHEWIVMVKKIGDRIGRVGTAYRVDCKPPYKCGNEDYMTILEKWVDCENFVLLWPIE